MRPRRAERPMAPPPGPINVVVLGLTIACWVAVGAALYALVRTCS